MEHLSIIRKVTGIIGNSPLIDLIRPREVHEIQPEGPPPTLLEFAHQHSLCLEIRKDGTGRYHVGFSDSPIFYRVQKSGQDPVGVPRRLYPRSSSNPLTAARKLCDKIRGKKLILDYEYGIPVTDQYVKKTVQVHKDIYVDEDEFAAYLQDFSGVL
ncbi:MAG: hypothetical protein ACE15F_05960 [bacterium]